MKKLIVVIIVMVILVTSMILKKPKKQYGVAFHPTIPIINFVEMYKPSELFEKSSSINQDFYGVIRIEGVIEEAVVLSKDNEEYLHIDIHGHPDIMGTVFMDYRVEYGDQNVILYGHTYPGKKDMVFSNLNDYKDYAFYQMHPTFTFETKQGIDTYDIFSVYVWDPSVYPYFFDVSFYSETFKEHIEHMKKSSMYPIELEVNEESQLLTLVTCNSDNIDQRVILVGVKR